jgi:hypothetical protein
LLQPVPFMPFNRVKTTTNARINARTNAGARRRMDGDNRIVVTMPRATAPVAAHPPAPATPAARNVNGVDMCSSIFEACKRAQSEHLDALGATCMFDVDGGCAPPWAVETLRSVIETMIADIARTAERTPGAAVGVTLRQSGGFWALAIAENLSGATGAARAPGRLAMVRALTDRIDCVCRALPNPNGSTIALAFPVGERPAAGTNRGTNRMLH